MWLSPWVSSLSLIISVSLRPSLSPQRLPFRVSAGRFQTQRRGKGRCHALRQRRSFRVLRSAIWPLRFAPSRPPLPASGMPTCKRASCPSSARTCAGGRTQGVLKETGANRRAIFSFHAVARCFSIHSLISDSSHAMLFGPIFRGFGKKPDLTQRQIVTRLLLPTIFLSSFDPIKRSFI